jgi:cysteine desulfurase/selenocysteine lyase
LIDVTFEFGLPDNRVWLNAAHQGPLPLCAAKSVSEVIQWKLQPHHLQDAAVFTNIPNQLRSLLAALISAPESEIVLANSASYGLSLLANGLDWKTDDEVIVSSTDFPSDILPWLNLKRLGVSVKQVRPQGKVLTVDEVCGSFTSRTRVLCLTWVHSFSGHVVDLQAIGNACREANVLFVVNGAQGVGAIPLDVADYPIDVLTSVGFKWLCGPYGTGFCWIGPRAAEYMHPTKLYWLNALTTDDLSKPELDISDISVSNTGQHDIFGTANFFNFAPFTEAVNLIVKTGISKIYSHNLELTHHLIGQVDSKRFNIGALSQGELQSSILFLKPKKGHVDELGRFLAYNGIDVAQRAGMIRISPHFYNTFDEIDRTVNLLNNFPLS